MSAKHTPGPWTVDDKGWVYSVPTDRVVFDPPVTDAKHLDDEDWANLHIGAAALDMAEALEALLADVENGVTTLGVREKARAALQKARTP